MSDTKDFLCLALDAAHEAGKIQKKGFGRKLQINFKGPRDPVTEIDHRCEEIIFNLIKKAFPSHNIISEEGSLHQTPSPFRWIIDPLDGTTNFTHAYPCFCVSIALEKNSEIIMGAVYNPVLEELFFAVKDEGARLNGNSIHVSLTDDLEHALLATGRLTKNPKKINSHFGQFRQLSLKAQGMRRDGSAVLDLCYVAMGRFDGFWEFGLKPWDTAAGSIIIKEAGGKITTFKGAPFNPFGSEVLASNGTLHKPIMDNLSILL
jgi:myo-inositol-1(or 4)-monophosphatase